MIKRLAAIKRRDNNEAASFLIERSDIISLKSPFEFVISQGERANSGLSMIRYS